jgi:hypothetical protein
MTVQSTTSRADYRGNNVTTLFTVPFYFLDNSHIKVVRTDNSTVPPTAATLVLGTDYVITGAGITSGGQVQTTIAPTATQILTVLRNVPFTQLIHYVPNDPFPAATHEQALDQLTMEVQELNEGLTHSLQYPSYEPIPNTLPAASSRANMLLGFDANGQQTLLPLPASVGAGDLRVERWADGVDYTSGTSASVTLSRAYATKANIGCVVMQGVVQDPSSYTVSGTTLTFNAVIPAGIAEIWCFGGTTLSLYVPPDGSVNDAQLAWNNVLTRIVPSVAALQNLDISKYQRASTNGYYPGGAGAGDYFYDPAFSQTSADGGSAISSLTGTGCWRLIQRGRVTLFQFGAKGDDIADDTAAVRAAVGWAVASGQPIYVPTTVAAYRLTSTINVTGYFQMVGESCFPTTYTGGMTSVRNKGSWFHIDHAGRGFAAIVTHTENEYLVSFTGIGTIRNQPTPSAGAFTPASNDWDFYMQMVELHMDDVFGLNPTQFCFTTGGPAAHYKRIRGQPLTWGIWTDFSADCCNYDDVHFWPFWSQQASAYAWTSANLRTLVFGRADTPFLSNIFSIFAFAGISFSTCTYPGYVGGVTTGMKASGLDFDGCTNGLIIEGTAHGVDAMFTNFRCQGPGGSAGSRGVFLLPGTSNAVLRFENFRAGLLGAEGIRVDGTNNFVYLGTNTIIDQWNLNSSSFNAIDCIGPGTNNRVFLGGPITTLSPTGSVTPYGGGGAFSGLLGNGTVNTTTDASGLVTVTHNLGATPTGLLFSMEASGAPLTVQLVAGSNAANAFTVKIINTTNGAGLNAGAVIFTWLAVF